MKNFIKNHKIISTILFLCIIVLLLLILAVGYVFLKLNKLSYHDGTVNFQTSELADISAGDDTESDGEYSEELISSEEAEGLLETEVILSDMEMLQDEDVFNILLLGTDERTEKFNTNARADSIMILSLNKKAQTIKLVSLQRGMGFPILEGDYKGEYDWLTHLFRYGGADLMLKSVREVLNVDVEYYVRVNFNTFAQLIDSVGGIDVELTAAEAAGLNGEVRTNARTKVKVTEGLNHLDGYDALQYSRLRYIDSDWKRVQRQRNVIQSVVTAAKGMSLLEINDMLDTVLPLIQTNLTSGDILGLISYAPAILGNKFEQMTIPAKGTYGTMTGLGGRTLYAVDFQTNSQILHEFLYQSEEE